MSNRIIVCCGDGVEKNTYNIIAFPLKYDSI